MLTLEGIVFISWTDESLFSLDWQSPIDIASIKILVHITKLG